jgi:hypothetical protein
MIFLFANFAEGRLTADLLADATELRISPSQAALFPSPDSGEAVSAVIADGNLPPEIVHITANPLTGVMTVLRAREGTASQAWRLGSVVVAEPTAEAVTYWASNGGQDAVDALNGRMDDIEGRLDTVEADVASILSDLDELPGNINTILGPYQLSVNVLSQAFADIDSAWALYQVSVDARLDDVEASVTTLSQAIVSQNTAIATFQANVNAAIDDANAAVQLQIQAVVDDQAAQATSITALQANFGDVSADLTQEALTRASADSAEAALRVALAASMTAADNTLQANLNTEATTRATNDTAEVTARTAAVAAVQGSLNTLSASFTAEQTLRTTQYSAQSTTNTSVSASIGTLTSSVSTHTAALASINGNLVATYGFVLDAGGEVVSFDALAGTGPAGNSVSQMKWGTNQFVIATAGGDEEPFVYDAINSTLSANATFQIASAFATSPLTLASGVAGGHIGTLLNCVGGQINILYNIWCEPRLEPELAPATTVQYPTTAHLTRNAVIIGSVAVQAATWINDNTHSGVWIVPGGMRMLMFRDSSPGGTVAVPVANTYQIYIENTGTFTTSYDYRQIITVENKR